MLPPHWFSSHDCRKEQCEVRANELGVPALGDTPSKTRSCCQQRAYEVGTDEQQGVCTEPPRCGEGWLTSPIYEQLDNPKLYVPVTFMLLSMAALHPAMILYGSWSDSNMWSNNHLAVSMHAIAVIPWWLGFVSSFHNLQDVVRMRTSWLRAVASSVGATRDEIDAVLHSTSRCTELVVEKLCEDKASETTTRSTDAPRYRMRKIRSAAKVAAPPDREDHIRALEAKKSAGVFMLRHGFIDKNNATGSFDPNINPVRFLSAVRRVQAGSRTFLKRKFGEYVTLEEFHQLKYFKELVLPKVTSEWEKICENDEQRAGKKDEFRQLCRSGPVSRLSSETTQAFREYLTRTQHVMPPPHRLGAKRATILGLETAKSDFALQRLRWSSHDGLRCALTTFSADEYERLQKWRQYLIAIVVLVAVLVGGYGFLFMRPLLTDFGGRKTNDTVANILLVYSGIVASLAIVISGAWLTSFLLAVAFSSKAVLENCESIAPWNSGVNVMLDGAVVSSRAATSIHKTWISRIENPCLELIHTTLPALSAWAPTMAVKISSYWAFVLLSMPITIVEVENEEHDFTRRTFLVLFVGVHAALPLLMLFAPAKLSMEVQWLLEEVNELRVRSDIANKDAERLADRAMHLCKYDLSLCIVANASLG